MEDPDTTPQSTTPLISSENFSYQSTSTNKFDQSATSSVASSSVASSDEESKIDGNNRSDYQEGHDHDHTNDAEALARKLMACNNNEDLEHIVMRRTLDIPDHTGKSINVNANGDGPAGTRRAMGNFFSRATRRSKADDRTLFSRMVTIISLACLGVLIIFVLLQVSTLVIGPASQPVGPYKLVEVQDGDDFFSHYTFYNGLDSEGSKGYINYVNRDIAQSLNIANVTWEEPHNVFGKRDTNASDNANANTNASANAKGGQQTKEPFVYMSTSPTADGPRNSVRLEGLRRFNRGLFILDLRHMPAGCSTWPAFWLTDEPNWPINGEIDIVEGVNGQSIAKTAMHSTKGCDMHDVPLGVMTGIWDTATGVPKKNGDIDTTVREARDCFVYDPHQWLNQGCIAMSQSEGTLGTPLNDKGGGVFVLEWDPANRFIKSWVFSPHLTVPENLRLSMETANDKENMNRIVPNPLTWGLPYAHFPIGTGTSCDGSFFKNMHLVFNLALCGSVAGNRFPLDCPQLNKEYGSCDNYVKADTSGMDEIYWKIRGVYVYQRKWERSWVN